MAVSDHVCLFTLVIEGKLKLDESLSPGHVWARERVKKKIEERIKAALLEPFSELDANDNLVWEFIFADTSSTGTICKKASEL